MLPARSREGEPSHASGKGWGDDKGMAVGREHGEVQEWKVAIEGEVMLRGCATGPLDS